ncbi:hypothetical protein Poly51_34740 [Rubripirellula tenax]|uniref:Ice-binding protein C-terminal domain-containing protein n=1 Tax=Rubripirellula tenax TaxID=2528015 RepID=A0A5C6F137_9BACT|nr:PEP-CTERM sorting domain-containing protein [Rubripirellula tenax]TWU54755.1 hypothetical protein Poly51_34740 [Rubripirellula tenax]
MFQKPLLSLSAILAGLVAFSPANVLGDLVLVFEGNHNGTVAQITNGGTGFETITLDFSTGANTPNGSYGYTISGIDAAADGTANDSLTFSFGVAAAGGNGDVAFQDDGNFGVTGNGAGNLNAADETLTFSLLSQSLTLGDPGTGSVTGGGFNRIAFSQLNSADETAVLSGGTSADGVITGATTFSPISTFTIGHTGDTSNFRVGPARYRFSITAEATAVPEPSSLALMAVASLGGWMHWRRKQRSLAKS